MKRLLLVAATIMVMLGVASAQSIAAPSSTAATGTEVARGWTSLEFAGTPVSMFAPADCQGLGDTIHSAILLNQGKVVRLYANSSCGLTSMVAVLTAANPVDSGWNALGEKTRLGAVGATHYRVT